MEKIGKDVLIQLSLDLNLKDLKNMSLSNKNFYRILWNNNDFWRNKFEKEFPYSIGKFEKSNNFLDIYIKTINSIFTKNDFDRFGEGEKINWKGLKYLEFNFTYYWRTKLFFLTLNCDFKYIWQYFFSKISNLQEKFRKKYKNDYFGKNWNKSIQQFITYNEDDRFYASQFPKIPGEDIINSFEPFLLNIFKENNISILFKGTIIQKSKSYEVDISDDII